MSLDSKIGMASAAELTKQGIAAHNAGDPAAASALFAQATEADPSYEMAWLWRSSVAATDADKRAYLEQALAANPDSAPAKRGLAQLGADGAVTAPPELAASVATERPAPAVGSSTGSGRAELERVIADYTRQGWQVVSQTETTAQLKKPKEWSRAGAVLFVLLPLLGGVLLYGPLLYVAIFGLLLLAVDYMVKKEELRFITADEAAQSVDVERARKERPFVERLPNGGTVCSACRFYARPGAATCKHCGVALNPPPIGL